jgi:hypothetical protein
MLNPIKSIAFKTTLALTKGKSKIREKHREKKFL